MAAPPAAPFELVAPDLTHLPGLVDALRSGWSPDNLRGPAATAEMLVQIAADPEGFVTVHRDGEAPQGARVTLPDGSTVPRLPQRTRWILSDGFAGHDRAQRGPPR